MYIFVNPRCFVYNVRHQNVSLIPSYYTIKHIAPREKIYIFFKRFKDIVLIK